MQYCDGNLIGLQSTKATQKPRIKRGAVGTSNRDALRIDQPKGAGMVDGLRQTTISIGVGIETADIY